VSAASRRWRDAVVFNRARGFIERCPSGKRRDEVLRRDDGIVDRYVDALAHRRRRLARRSPAEMTENNGLCPTAWCEAEPRRSHSLMLPEAKSTRKIGAGRAEYTARFKSFDMMALPTTASKARSTYPIRRKSLYMYGNITAAGTPLPRLYGFRAGVYPERNNASGRLHSSQAVCRMQIE
jgi:hypothetical protein